MRSVATLLADPPAASSTEQPSATGSPEAPTASAAPESPKRSCASCGSPMQASQDWCLSCGAGAPGSLATPARSSRLAATVLGLTALLVAGAATAAYAAWGKGTTTHRVVAIVVGNPSSGSSTPAPATPGAATPAVPQTLGTPTTITPSAKALIPPKIPLTAATPKSPSAATTTPSPAATAPSTTTGSSNAAGGVPVATAPAPTAIALDTNAAATYNPYAYPASRFGDPSLAVDGDTSTAWTAQVDPAVAPRMAEGLVIDLKSARKLSALGLVTSTPGMTIQVYGADSKALPASITDPAWVHLSPTQVEKNKHSQIKLSDSTKPFRFVTLWIVKAPAGSTAQAPGHVSVNELELFPA
jgi:hypothetical protein